MPTPTGHPAQRCWFSGQAHHGPHGPTKCPALWFLERAHHGPWSCPSLLVLGAVPPWIPRSHQVPSTAGSRLACQALLVFILPALPGSQHYTSEKRPWCLQTDKQNTQSCRDLHRALWGWWLLWCVLPRARDTSDAGPACSRGPVDVITEDCRSSGNVTCSRSHLGFGH